MALLQVLALPISCDASMPDYIVKADVFERGMKRHWHHSDRFRMFFATSYGHKAGGTFIVCVIAKSSVCVLRDSGTAASGMLYVLVREHEMEMRDKFVCLQSALLLWLVQAAK